MVAPDKQFTLQLNLGAIAGMAIESARATADVVGLALQLVEDAGGEAVGRHQSRHADFNFGPPRGSPADRLQARRRWLLTKGFQDLTVATRRALEEADVLLGFAATPRQTTTLNLVNAQHAQLRRRANRSNLPDLIARIEEATQAPLAWTREIVSLNAARNCLEHRGGCVGEQDLDPGSDRLCVVFPRPRMFYVHEGKEVEFELPHRMPDADEGAEIPVFIQSARRSFEFRKGEVVDFSAADFAEITFSVWYFATDLTKKVQSSPIMASLPNLAIPTDGAQTAGTVGAPTKRT